MKGIFLAISTGSRRRRALTFACGFALAATAVPTGHGQQFKGQQPSPPVDTAPATDASEPALAPPEVIETIKKLDDDHYASRQAAQRLLTATGRPALEATASVAATGSLESSTRAVNILWKWAESNDKSVNRAALEKLAALANRPVEAADAQRRLAVLLEAEAIEKIVELGGQVVADRAYGLIGGDNAPLQVIIGKNWTGGVDGLKHVADVRRATTLSLWSAPFEDEVLPQLATLRNVRRMELYGLQLTPELVDQTHNQLMSTTSVEVRGPARLGIRGIEATEIVPNSPAAKAGLMVNDRIVEFNGKSVDTGMPIDDFSALTTEIGKCKVGETVEVNLRGTEIRTAKVTFDAWGDDVNPGAPADVPPEQQGLFGRPPAFVPGRALPFRPAPIVPRAIRPEPADPALPK